MPAKLTTERVRERLNAKGYDLVGEYRGAASGTLIDAFCRKHLKQYSVRANGLVSGSHNLPCCGIESIRKKMTGRAVSAETRQKCSEVQQNGRAYWSGKRLSADHRRNIGDAGRAHFGNVDAIINHARCGSTAGKPGHFYIIRVGDELKFGSVSKMTPELRMAKVRRDTGKDCELLMAVNVPDAGTYEAAMMERHRDHWVRHEYFKDFRQGAR